jgi:hypothetical protein
LLALLLSAASHTIAQNIKAALNGRAKDSQNNAGANAAIAGADPERGQSRSLVSGAQGRFHMAGLEPANVRHTWMLAPNKLNRANGKAPQQKPTVRSRAERSDT